MNTSAERIERGASYNIAEVQATRHECPAGRLHRMRPWTAAEYTPHHGPTCVRNSAFSSISVNMLEFSLLRRTFSARNSSSPEVEASRSEIDASSVVTFKRRSGA